MKSLSILVAAIVAAAVVQSPAAAQNYPDRPIKLLVGYAPGASTDLMARFAASQMSELLGQSVVVENKAGANAAIATHYVADSAADGYTLLFNGLGQVSNIYGLKEPGYKTSDFIDIGPYAYSPYTLFVNTKSSGAKSMKEFIAFGKAHPDTLTYASLGPSSPPNLTAHHFDDAVKIGWREVPYKSAADAVQAVVAGMVDVYFAAPSTALASINQPNIAVFAVTGKTRSPQLPNVPTFQELGVTLDDSLSLGIFARADTPKPVVDKLRKALADAKSSETNRKKVEATGLSIYDGDWQVWDADLAEQGRLFADDFKRLNLTPQ